MAAVTIVKPTKEISNILYNYSEHLGLIFQIKDDLLDVYGDEKKLGKPVGSDEKNHKNTYVTLLGQDETEIKLEYHVNQAENSLAQLKNSGYDTAQLEELTKLFYNRDH